MDGFGSRSYTPGGHRADVRRLLLPYNISVEGVEAWDKGYRIWTDEGLKILWLFEGTREEFEYVAAAIQYLHSRGFANHEDLIPTREGALYVDDGDHLYYLTSPPQGEMKALGGDRVWGDGVRLLAGFHKASKGFDSHGVRDVWGDWEGEFMRRYERLQEYRASIEQRWRRSDFDRWFLYYVDYSLFQCEKAVEMLSSSTYRDVCRWRRSEGGFCHGRLRSGNIVETAEGGLYLLDLGGVVGDIPARDIGDLLIFEGVWDLANVNALLEAYHENNPLTREEIELIGAYIRFPHLFWDVFSHYYKEGRLDRRLVARVGDSLKGAEGLAGSLLTVKVYLSMPETGFLKDKYSLKPVPSGSEPVVDLLEDVNVIPPLGKEREAKDVSEGEMIGEEGSEEEIVEGKGLESPVVTTPELVKEEFGEDEGEVKRVERIQGIPYPDEMREFLKELGEAIEKGDEEALTDLALKLKDLLDVSGDSIWAEFIKLGDALNIEELFDTLSKTGLVPGVGDEKSLEVEKGEGEEEPNEGEGSEEGYEGEAEKGVETDEARDKEERETPSVRLDVGVKETPMKEDSPAGEVIKAGGSEPKGEGEIAKKVGSSGGPVKKYGPIVWGKFPEPLP